QLFCGLDDDNEGKKGGRAHNSTQVFFLFCSVHDNDVANDAMRGLRGSGLVAIDLSLTQQCEFTPLSALSAYLPRAVVTEAIVVVAGRQDERHAESVALVARRRGLTHAR